MAKTDRQRCAGEGGAVLVEAAMITPVLFLFLFGILEFGILFYANQTITNGSTAIARTAAIQGSDLEADYQIIQAAKSAMGGVNSSSINRIVIFRATGPTTPVPAACKTGGSSSSLKCNVYTPIPHFGSSLTAAAFDCAPSPAPNYADAWCPTTRKTALTGSNGPPDYLGIYIEYTHEWVTGLFGSDIVLSETKITKLEPTRVL